MLQHAGPAPRIICLGHSALDHTFRVAAIPSSAGKIRADSYDQSGGGMAATAAVTVARLGGNAAFWGRAGDDTAGRFLRDELAAEGVDVTGFHLQPGARSSVSGIFVDDRGERLIANFRGSDLPREPDWLRIDDVAEADAVLADPRWPEGALALFEAARKAAVPTVLDGDVADPEIFDALLPLTDHAVFSAPALAGLAGAEVDAALDRVARYGCPVAAVTQGENGVRWLERERFRSERAISVNAVDTTGAGDAFHGAYAFCIGAGEEPGPAFRFAAAVAALKCTKPGARAGIPTFSEILAFLESASSS